MTFDAVMSIVVIIESPITKNKTLSTIEHDRKESRQLVKHDKESPERDAGHPTDGRGTLVSYYRSN